jgi:prephenate dehydrogenase
MPEGCFFVGGHPIAGTEHSGAKASFATLFQGRRCILTPTSRTNQQALELVQLFGKQQVAGLSAWNR